MKAIFSLFFISVLFLFISCGNEQIQPVQDSGFDSDLANELGADDLGMRVYVMAILKAGPNRDHDEATAMQIQQGHMDHMRQMHADGKLVLAGPFINGGDLRGIFLFNVTGIDEARELTEMDPAVQAGRLSMELVEWYGSAALLKNDEIHQKIAQQEL